LKFEKSKGLRLELEQHVFISENLINEFEVVVTMLFIKAKPVLCASTMF
jgi:hypothetical protein